MKAEVKVDCDIILFQHDTNRQRGPNRKPQSWMEYTLTLSCTHCHGLGTSSLLLKPSSEPEASSDSGPYPVTCSHGTQLLISASLVHNSFQLVRFTFSVSRRTEGQSCEDRSPVYDSHSPRFQHSACCVSPVNTPKSRLGSRQHRQRSLNPHAISPRFIYSTLLLCSLETFYSAKDVAFLTHATFPPLKLFCDIPKAEDFLQRSWLWSFSATFPTL